MDEIITPAEEASGKQITTNTCCGHKKTMAGLMILTIVVSSIFGALFGFMSSGVMQRVMPNLARRFPSILAPGKTSQDIVRETVVQEDSAVIDVVQKTSPAVVSIVISKDMPKAQAFNPFDFPGFDPFNPFGAQPDQGNPNNGNSSNGTQKQTIGGGSGFIITADGMIVTNKHVVADTTADYTVVTTDGKEHKATVLARDPVNDVAVIKIDGANYPTLNLGDSDAIKIGQTVIAIGNSLGEFSNTVSRGIISGLGRSLTASAGRGGQSETLNNIIQTDAAINPGNSGGPLLDINGTVIGINVAIAQGAQNIGFAIPANQIKKAVDQVKATGKISTPYLGIRYIPVTADIQKANNLPYAYGVLVSRGATVADLAVIPGSPADKAGITENDLILEVNGTKIDEKNTLVELISKYNIGDQVTLKIWHKGVEKDVLLTLEERK
jgi:S1-C subfamily serine protease